MVGKGLLRVVRGWGGGGWLVGDGFRSMFGMVTGAAACSGRKKRRRLHAQPRSLSLSPPTLPPPRPRRPKKGRGPLQPAGRPHRGGNAYACASAAANISMQIKKSCSPSATSAAVYVVNSSRTRSTPVATRIESARPC